MHALIAGTTQSGKSTLAKLLCKTLHDRGKVCAVLTPTSEAGWEATFKTSDGPTFLKWVRENERAFCFVDESGDAIGRYNSEMDWLATGSRHRGHSVTFCVQASHQISTAIRSCCQDVFIFATSKGVLKLLAEDFNEPLILSHEKIPQYHFLHVSRFTAVGYGRLDNGGKTCYIGGRNVFDQTTPAMSPDGTRSGGKTDANELAETEAQSDTVS